MKAKHEKRKGLFWTSSGLFFPKERIPFYFPLCLFNYPSKHECEGCLYALNECTLERSTCLQWGWPLVAWKSSRSLSSHADKNSWLQRDGDSFQSELWELPQSAVGPVTTPWPRGQPSLDLENVIETKDQPLLRANRKHHQCGRELLTELRVSPPQGWAVVVRSRHLLGSSHEGTTLMSQAAHLWVAFVLTQYFDLYYFIGESHVPVRFGRSVMIIPIYRWVSNGLKRLGLGSPGGQTTGAHPLFLDSKFGLLSAALQCFSY